MARPSAYIQNAIAQLFDEIEEKCHVRFATFTASETQGQINKDHTACGKSADLRLFFHKTHLVTPSCRSNGGSDPADPGTENCNIILLRKIQFHFLCNPFVKIAVQAGVISQRQPLKSPCCSAIRESSNPS